MHGIAKTFPGVRALDGVDLDVRAGEVHCLLGQNGAGKSTLIKVLAGAHQPDAGTITWRGEQVSLGDPQAAMSLGIATIYQELDLVAGLSVSDNIFLGREELAAGHHPAGGRQPRGVRAARPASATRRSGPSAEVGSLSAASQQMVSIARALSQDAKLIIMDEPSAVLDNEEVERLFGVIRDLTAHDVAVVYISHRLEEIRQIGDRITVLKDGRTVATGLPARETSTREVITLMTGRTIEYVFPPRQAAPPAGEPAARGRGAGPARQLRRRQLRRPPGRDRRAGRPRRLGALGDPRDHLRRPQGDRRHGPAGRQAAARRATSAPRWPAASASRRRSARARRCCSTTPSTATSRVSSLGRFARGGFLSGAGRAGRGPRADRVARRPAGRRDPDRPHPVGRQPAEGRAGPLAAPRLQGAAPRRADPRRRRRARGRRSTRWSAPSPTAASPSSWSPARSRRSWAWPTASW